MNGDDEECLELSDEGNSCDEKDSQVLFQQHQGVLSYLSEKTEHSYMKEILTVNTVVPNRDVSISSRHEFPRCHLFKYFLSPAKVHLLLTDGVVAVPSPTHFPLLRCGTPTVATSLMPRAGLPGPHSHSEHDASATTVAAQGNTSDMSASANPCGGVTSECEYLWDARDGSIPPC